MAYNPHRKAVTEGNQLSHYQQSKAFKKSTTAKANGVDEDCDNINFANYKGIYAEESGNSEKYTCPVTGAHFEFLDMGRRLQKIIEKRKPYADQLYVANSSVAAVGNGAGLKGVVNENADFTVSMLSVSDELVA
jgi:hypothetical protein